MSTSLKTTPLTVKIVNNQLRILIGIDTLKMAAENCPEFYDGKSGKYVYTVTNKQRFAEEVVRQLDYAEEDGSSPLTRLFDQSFEDVVEDGGEGIELRL